jgi:hypothetical protein
MPAFNERLAFKNEYLHATKTRDYLKEIHWIIDMKNML